MGLDDRQRHNLHLIERVASTFSLLGAIFIFITFLTIKEFRRPINRLIFYASWGNALSSIATIIAQAGTRNGPASPLCQFQAFLIELATPTDAYWALAMTVNVYLIVFRNFDFQQLRALEMKYHALAYGMPTVTAIVLIFVESKQRGKVYGDAGLWCWISKPWDFLRTVTLYVPAWICIGVSLGIYIMTGWQFLKWKRSMGESKDGEPSAPRRPRISGTPEPMSPPSSILPSPLPVKVCEPTRAQSPERACRLCRVDAAGLFFNASEDLEATPSRRLRYEHYTVNIAASAPVVQEKKRPKLALRAPSLSNEYSDLQARTAASDYTRVAILFFLCLLIAWIPSSANRFYNAQGHAKPCTPLVYLASLGLSLMGFTNAIIYACTSMGACQTLLRTLWPSTSCLSEPSRTQLSSRPSSVAFTPDRKRFTYSSAYTSTTVSSSSFGSTSSTSSYAYRQPRKPAKVQAFLSTLSKPQQQLLFSQKAHSEPLHPTPFKTSKSPTNPPSAPLP